MRDSTLSLRKKNFSLKDSMGLECSTTDALTDITKRIRNGCDKGYYACGAFLDFRKVFDTVNHKILLNKLIHYGIRGKAVDWFQSFLSHRVQYTSVSGFDSEPSLVTHGLHKYLY